MPSRDLAIPVLPSRSLPDTVAFYRQLGFDGTIHSRGDVPDGNLIRIGQVQREEIFSGNNKPKD